MPTAEQIAKKIFFDYNLLDDEKKAVILKTIDWMANDYHRVSIGVSYRDQKDDVLLASLEKAFYDVYHMTMKMVFENKTRVHTFVDMRCMAIYVYKQRSNLPMCKWSQKLGYDRSSLYPALQRAAYNRRYDKRFNDLLCRLEDLTDDYYNEALQELHNETGR